MTAQRKKRGRPPFLWKSKAAGKTFADAVLYFKFERHPVRGHVAAIRKVLTLPEFAYLKRYTDIRYLEKKFQEALAFWYPPSKEYPQPKAKKNKRRIRGTQNELREHNPERHPFR